MVYNQPIQLYRYWYGKLLRLYPRSYYERFGEEMEQTFTDLYREQTKKGLFSLILWIFIETSVGIIKEHLHYINMQKNIIRVALATAGILLIPFFGNIYIDGWNWSMGDFIFAFILIFGAGLAFETVRKSSKTTTYKAAAGIALVTAFFLVWINAAVGIIGDNNPTNTLYPGIIFIGIIGTIVARLESRRMSYILFAMAGALVLAPAIAFFTYPSNFAPGVVRVFALSTFFAILFIISALLFRQASASGSK
jgi:hypothetical protein